MIGGVTRCILPHLSGVPHLHVNRPLVERVDYTYYSLPQIDVTYPSDFKMGVFHAPC